MFAHKMLIITHSNNFREDMSIKLTAIWEWATGRHRKMSSLPVNLKW